MLQQLRLQLSCNKEHVDKGHSASRSVCQQQHLCSSVGLLTQNIAAVHASFEGSESAGKAGVYRESPSVMHQLRDRRCVLEAIEHK